VFLHTIVIYIPVAIFFGIWPGSSALLVLPGLALLLANLFWMALVLGILASRFRDIIQMVTTLIQIMMFATPIMWPVSSLKGETWIAEVNPVYHFIELIRAPLLGTPPALLSWVVSVATVVVGSGAALYLLNRASKRIVFWI
jgi:ABC-type polysaccharide/polyol phosphate export permease